MASHGHFHRFHARNALPEPVAAADPATLVSVVYVTAAPTFDGPIGGYTTVGVTAAADPTSEAPIVAAPTKTPAAVIIPTPKTSSAAAIKQSSSSPAAAKSSSALDIDTKSLTSSAAKEASSSALPTEIIAPSTSFATSAAIAVATNSLPTASNPTLALNIVPSASSSAKGSTSSSDGEMSAGGKAGIAIGILLLIGAILSLVLYCFKKRKNKANQALADNEKNDNPFADPTRTASIRSSPNAPRLSLRPVTEFIPNLMERRASRGNALMTGTADPMTEKALPMVRPDTAQSNEANPFGNHAETIDYDNKKGPVAMTSPVVEHATAPSPVQSTPVPDAVPAADIGTAVGAPVAVAAATGLKRGASKRENAPKHLDFTKAGPFMGPPSPAGTEFSTNSDSAASPIQTSTSAAIAAAGGPATSAVHRVQLDFKPSMDDELELRAGQLIRMLHEYDDGWALCIRLDRSQQGVVPRTCLSTRPVKPRPQQSGTRGPPQGRPMSPGMNQQGRPMTPQSQQGRPMTPTGQQGRPMTPNSQGRSRGQSNAQMQPMQTQGRPRAPSNPQQQRRNSPPGPSRMNQAGPMNNNGPAPLRTPSGNAPQRKPVPGQAL